MSSSPGRPRQASQELLQEAAFELFQLRGYRKTSVELIARTAGFSRATFFNFFASKAELFWVETDRLIESLAEYLETEAATEHPLSLHQGLLDYSGTIGTTEIPWALQHYRLLEAADDLVASGAGRVLRINRLFLTYLQRTASAEAATADPAAASAPVVAGQSTKTRVPTDPVWLQGQAASLTSLLLVALLSWVDAGVDRGALRGHLERSLGPATL